MIRIVRTFLLYDKLSFHSSDLIFVFFCTEFGQHCVLLLRRGEVHPHRFHPGPWTCSGPGVVSSGPRNVWAALHVFYLLSWTFLWPFLSVSLLCSERKQAAGPVSERTRDWGPESRSKPRGATQNLPSAWAAQQVLQVYEHQVPYQGQKELQVGVVCSSGGFNFGPFQRDEEKLMTAAAELQEKKNHLHIPDPPGPLCCGFYSRPGQFWLSVVLLLLLMINRALQFYRESPVLSAGRLWRRFPVSLSVLWGPEPGPGPETRWTLWLQSPC